MAAHIGSSEIKALSVVAYKDLRNTLRSGDLLFASGDYLVSKAIQKVSDSPWSHVGIIIKLNDLDRVLLLESVEDMGVRLVPLSKYLTDYEDGKPYRGRVVVGRCKGVDKQIVDGLTTFGIDELTRPYDKDEIAKILARVVLGIGKKERDREYICSELVYECFSNSGLEFDYDKRGFISPENIWRDDDIVPVGRIL